MARGLLWEVVHVQPAGEQIRFRLRCAQGDLRGQEFDLFHPFEDIRPVSPEFRPERAGRLRPWLLYHQAFLLEQELGPDALAAVQPGRLSIAPYQLVPVMRALRMSRPRLLLADGVGLGKTIQAGLVMTELIARRRAHRILVVSPPGPLLNQWRREMRNRFGLRFKAVQDWGTLQEERRALVLGANPFDHMALCLASIDFAKQEKVLEFLDRATWDLVVIDEAHHCVRMGSAGDGEDSRRRRLAEVLARQSDGLLLLTATPHDGYDAHFASLVELLDPSLLDGRGALRGDLYARHVVRRLQRHVKDHRTGKPLFLEREVDLRPVDLERSRNSRFASYQEAVLSLVVPRLRAAMRRRQYGEVLAFVSLLKRSASTARACRNTLQVVLDRYKELLRTGEERQEERGQRLATLRDYQRRLERYGSLSFEEEEDQAALLAEDIAAEILASGAEELVESIGASRREARREGDRLKRIEETRDALTALVALASEAAAEDPKLDAVVKKVKEIRAREPRANILIYTEYLDSQDALRERLSAAISSKEITGEALALSGPDPEGVRSLVLERFESEDDLLLVSTDATAEGLNLHERCHHLIHLELPYNPNRLEQRNGRIDRYGQRQTPRVSYLYLPGTFEERLLLRLVAKYERQRARLTFVPNTLGIVSSGAAGLNERLLEGLARDEHTLFRPEPRALRLEEVREDDASSAAYRELLLEMDRAIAGFDKAAKTHAWLGDRGLHAEEKRSAEAAEAKDKGERQGAVDLVDFVCRAIEDEVGGDGAVAREPDGTLAIRLPPAWTSSMEEMPGYDCETRTIRLTTGIEEVRDARERPLGFLGRAHPIVRRALDRVRNTQFGGEGSPLDRRVSAVRSFASEPELLLTFLGTVKSGAGREYERLLAVRLGRDGPPRFIEDPREWEALVGLDRQVPTAGLWERHFASWAPARKPEALRVAGAAFESMAQAFRLRHQADLASEREALKRWLDSRADELCGAAQEVRQVDLLADEESARPRWKAAGDPSERLEAFAGDGSVPPVRRQEARGVISLWEKRAADLDRRSELEVAEPAPLGLLMLVPGKAGG